MGMVSTKRTSSSSSLPLDLIFHILLRLPLKSVCRFQCVCKQWHHDINSPNFRKIYHQKQINVNSDTNYLFIECYNQMLHSVDLKDLDCNVAGLGTTSMYIKDSVLDRISNVSTKNLYQGVVVGSCNGLLCIQTHIPHGQYTVYNPTTNDAMILPTREGNYGFVTEDQIEFGYDCVSRDYKVMCLFTSLVDEPNLPDADHAHIYSLKSNSWKTIEPCPWGRDATMSDCCHTQTNSTVVNNAFHWISRRRYFDYLNDDGRTITNTICAFDLATEAYHKVPPPPLEAWHDDINSLASLRGNLYVCFSDLHDTSEIWVMEEYGVEESWQKLFCCSDNHIRNIFTGSYCGNIVPASLQGDDKRLFGFAQCRRRRGGPYEGDEQEYYRALVCLDLQNQTMTKVEMKGLPGIRYAVMPCTRSLVPLNSTDQ